MRRLVAIGSLVLVACSASTVTIAEGPGAGGSGGSGDPGDPNGGDGGVADGGARGDARSGGDGGASGPVKKGQITIAQTATVAGQTTYYSSYASAYFYSYDPNAIGSASCALSTVSGCSVTECNFGGGTATDAGVQTPPNAGTLTITGGQIAGAMTLTPTNVNGAYTVPVVQSRIFSPGATLTVSASGANVPAFSGKTVRAPSDLQLTAPVFDSQARTTVSRTSALGVTWTGGTGSVQVALNTSQQGVRSVSVTCIFPASGGGAQVPAAAMGKLDRANGTSIYGSMTVTPFEETAFSSGDWDVVFRASATGKSGLFTATN